MILGIVRMFRWFALLHPRKGKHRHSHAGGIELPLVISHDRPECAGPSAWIMVLKHASQAAIDFRITGKG